MRFVHTAAAAAVAVTAASSAAQTPVFGHAHAPRGQVDNKIYPLSEHRYIKQFPGPRVNCGPCFGFYKPAVRPWHEACGEPEPENFGPKQFAGPGGTPDLPNPPVGDKKPADPEPLDKNGKDKEKAPPPNQGKDKDAGAGTKKEPTVAIPVLVAPPMLPPAGK